MKAASESSPTPQPLEALKSASALPNYADAIKKLFRCDGRSQQGHPNTAKIRETAKTYRKDGSSKESSEPSAKKQCEYAVEVVLIPAFTNVIPKGHYKQKLFEGGLVQHMAFKRSDNAATIEIKISSLFPAFFDTVDKTFTYLDASSKHLEKQLSPPSGYSAWNGETIEKLAGQGRLYILLSHSVNVSCILF